MPANNASNHAACRAMQGRDCSCLYTLSPCTMSSKGTVRFLPVASSTKPVACMYQRHQLWLYILCWLMTTAWCSQVMAITLYRLAGQPITR